MPDDVAASFFEEVFDSLQGSGSAKLKASTLRHFGGMRRFSHELMSANPKPPNQWSMDDTTQTQECLRDDLPWVSQNLGQCQRESSDRSGCVQVNVLNYLQSIISGQATANPVMDSPITALIVAMLRAPQQGAFQVLLATILGLLVRHCTFIPAQLAECGEALPLSRPVHTCSIPCCP